jgi:hypothetical protein
MANASKHEELRGSQKTNNEKAAIRLSSDSLQGSDPLRAAESGAHNSLSISQMIFINSKIGSDRPLGRRAARVASIAASGRSRPAGSAATAPRSACDHCMQLITTQSALEIRLQRSASYY